MSGFRTRLELAEYFTRYSKRVADSPDSLLPKHPLDEWGEDVLSMLRDRIVRFRPEVLLCGLATMPLGATVRRETKTPLCHVNSTFYIGPGSRRTPEADFARADDTVLRFVVPLLDQTDLVLHDTDPIFHPPPPSAPSHHHWVSCFK
jgi:hypothetical protein